MHELLGDEVDLVTRRQGQLLDLTRDALLLLERQVHGRRDVGERDLRRLDGGDHDLLVGVDEVLDHHHRVIPLFHRLAVEVRGELRQRLRVVVDGDRDVLLRRTELVRDLFVEGIREARHAVTLTRPGTTETARGRLRRARRCVGSLHRRGLQIGLCRLDGDAPRLGLLGLRHVDLEHAVSVRRRDLRVVGAGRQADGPDERPVPPLEAVEAVLRQLVRPTALGGDRQRVVMSILLIVISA